MKSILVSGCSYSYGSHSYGNVLNDKGYKTKMLSYPGQSNNGTIYKIYKHIKENNIQNSVIVCQLTWLHRFGAYNSVVKKWMDYQPNAGNVMPSYDEVTDYINFEINLNEGLTNTPGFDEEHNIPKDMYVEMLNMYTNYLKYHYDENEAFDYLMYQIDTLKAFIDASNNKIIFIYWPTFSNNNQLEQIKKRNFFNIDGEYSILKWSIKTNLLDGSSHLSDIGHSTFANLIEKSIDNL